MKKILAVTITLFSLVALIQSCQAANLLVNGGFEEEQAPYYFADGNGAVVVDQGWTCQAWTAMGNPYTSYMRRESSFYKDAPEPEGSFAPWLPRTGTEAARHCTSGQGHHQMYQDIAVSSLAAYSASLWVYTVDLTGNGFGVEGSGDSAGLHIIELAADGSVVLDHTPVVTTAVTGAGNYVECADSFTTQANTATVRFMAETYIGGLWADYGHWQHGYVTYDDGVFEAVPEPSSLLTLAGLLPIAGFAIRRRR